MSAAKLRGDTLRLNAATPFAAWTNEVTGSPKPLENLDVSSFPENNLIVVMSTDKGLCGGVNTILSRMTRQMVARLEAAGKKYQLFILGEKGRGALRRTHGSSFLGSATERVMPYTFDLSCCLAQDLLQGEYDAIHLLYNKFKSAIAYEPSIKSITPLVDPTSEFFYPFAVEPSLDPETLFSFFEYTLATQIHHSLMENATAEQSSRMTAMENASKNAGEMIGKLTLQYNRARQSRITTELIEIISGASALETKK